jgi:hypothetical protein
MRDIRPAYFYEMGFAVHSVTHLSDSVPAGLRADITRAAWLAMEQFVADDTNKEMLPQAHTKAEPLLTELRLWVTASYSGRTCTNYEQLSRTVEKFSTTLTDELDRSFNYVLTDRGNLSVARLVEGASIGYGPSILAVIDSSVTGEIDEAGRCLAFAVYTACGFHILRSVEIGIKAYIYAATGSLPPMNRRNWGEYIDQLVKSGATSDFVDLVKILRTKRNPLMHPQDRLTETEAIDVFCICQAVTGALIDDVRARALEAKFTAALPLLPKV